MWESTPIKSSVFDKEVTATETSSLNSSTGKVSSVGNDSAYASSSPNNSSKSSSENSLSSPKLAAPRHPRDQKNCRTSYTPDQVEIFQKVFENTAYPDGDTIENLAKQTDIPEKKIRVRNIAIIVHVSFTFPEIH